MKSDPAAARPAPPSASLGAHLGSDLGIDGALARLAEVESTATEVGQRLDRAIGAVADVLARGEATDHP